LLQRRARQSAQIDAAATVRRRLRLRREGSGGPGSGVRRGARGVGAAWPHTRRRGRRSSRRLGFPS
jgi:hypothetical protein